MKTIFFFSNDRLESFQLGVHLSSLMRLIFIDPMPMQNNIVALLSLGLAGRKGLEGFLDLFPNTRGESHKPSKPKNRSFQSGTVSLTGHAIFVFHRLTVLTYAWPWALRLRARPRAHPRLSGGLPKPTSLGEWAHASGSETLARAAVVGLCLLAPYSYCAFNPSFRRTELEFKVAYAEFLNAAQSQEHLPLPRCYGIMLSKSAGASRQSQGDGGIAREPPRRARRGRWRYGQGMLPPLAATVELVGAGEAAEGSKIRLQPEIG
ncbi:uncharacterized protein VTP21DRAFT_10365 [Calcarisporiella thermophila]|uniref:uncharacterized protein n=1 Tax=Calcarisporiella thermophila TaxID=911321 RepID=UPI003742875B